MELQGWKSAGVGRLATREAREVVNEATKMVKCAHLEASHHFILVAMESLGVF